ncbi:MAG: hypothetical protein JWM53_2411 [bacterium]|nr:hypothetical protein [bacterium]
MSIRNVLGPCAALCLVCTTAVAAPLPHKRPTRKPALTSAAHFDRWKQRARFARMNHLSVETKGLVATGAHDSAARLRTFPQWKGSFSSAGTTYPFIMAGGNPRRGDETRLATSFIALSFAFDEFADADGNPLVIDTQPIVDDVLRSPNFVATKYSDGFGQFSDAVQRASFYDVMERDWHTTLERPRILTPVTIEVPIGLATVEQIGGKYIANVDFDFLYSQLQTILQLEGVRTDELVVLVSRNVATNYALGFHDAIDVTANGKKGIQTYTWTSWYDADVVPAIFADATTITHEISEWIADPLVNNMTPEYMIPASGSPPACQAYLEVGDPIEFLDNQMIPVTVHGKTYHTQVETMLQWFSRENPSSGFQGAYSYPDTTVLTMPSDPCPPPTTP